MSKVIPHQLHLSAKQAKALLEGKSTNVPHRQMGADKGSEVVMLHPQTARKMLTAFKKGKGMRLTLSPVEAHHTEMAGKGIFGKQFDRFVKKSIGKKATKQLYGVAEKVGKPLLNKAIDAGAMALEAYAPGASPAILAGKRALKGYIDRPSEYQKNPSKALEEDVNLQGMAEDYAKDQINSYLGAPIVGSGRKGSAEMRERMAMLRAMRGKKGKGATMSAPFQQALRHNFSGLALNNVSNENKPIGSYRTNPAVKRPSSEMTLSPYQNPSSPAMNPFIPRTYTQEGGATPGYAGRGLYGGGLYGGGLY